MAGTGPMSAVAGAMAEYISRDILEEYIVDEVIVENGGDIFMKLTSRATVSVFAGTSPLSDKIGLDYKTRRNPAVGMLLVRYSGSFTQLRRCRCLHDRLSLRSPC